MGRLIALLLMVPLLLSVKIFIALGEEELVDVGNDMVLGSSKIIEASTLELAIEEKWEIVPLAFVVPEPESLVTPEPSLEIELDESDLVEEEVIIVELELKEILLKDFSTGNWTPLGRERTQTAWTIFWRLKAAGWGYQHIAAGAGNFFGECSMWYAPDYSAYYKGICQWEPRRWDKLVAEGFAMDTLEGQLDAMLWELENDYTGVYERFLAAETMAGALRIFTNEYEVGMNYDVRLFYAEQFTRVFSEQEF